VERHPAKKQQPTIAPVNATNTFFNAFISFSSWNYIFAGFPVRPAILVDDTTAALRRQGDTVRFAAAVNRPYGDNCGAFI
jgi:hypothetical protein